MSNYFGSPFDDNIHFPYLQNPNQELYKRVSLQLKPKNLGNFKSATLLYIFHSKDRRKFRKQIAQLLFKSKFSFHRKWA